MPLPLRLPTTITIIGIVTNSFPVLYHFVLNVILNGFCMFKCVGRCGLAVAVAAAVAASGYRCWNRSALKANFSSSKRKSLGLLPHTETYSLDKRNWLTAIPVIVDSKRLADNIALGRWIAWLCWLWNLVNYLRQPRALQLLWDSFALVYCVMRWCSGTLDDDELWSNVRHITSPILLYLF